jgi:hypothetical protein
MLERLRLFSHIKHRKSGKEFSTLQKLNLFYYAQRRTVLMLRSQLELLAAANPTIKTQCYDALRSVGACEDALFNEYTRDRNALLLHKMEVVENG